MIPNTPNFADKLDRAIKNSVDNREVVIKWAAAIEVLDTDGERAIYCTADADSSTWDTQGMLTYFMERLTSRSQMADLTDYLIAMQQAEDDLPENDNRV